MAHRIFIVDDDKNLVEILTMALEKAGYEVFASGDGRSAIGMLKDMTPDLLLVDLTMPGMDGWRFTMKVRQDPRFVKTPIIVFSGLLDQEKKAEPHESANIYLPKPFDIMDLMNKIKEFLHD